MNTPAHIVDIDETNAQQLLIEESHNRPIVVDFWADWCEPCKQLMPLLEKLADEYAGAFLLAKVNADEQQMLASQLGVRSLPTVMVIKDGQPVDGFAGAQPETAVREMLEKHLPSPWNAKIAEATELLDSGDTAAALALLSLIHTQGAAVKVGAVHFGHRVARVLGVGVGHETEAS